MSPHRYQPDLGLVEREVALPADWSLRWRDGRSHWRHRADGGLDRRLYDVAPIADRTAKAYVLRHHYQHSYVASRFRFGLFEERTGDLLGVAVFSVPVQRAVLTRAFPALEPYVESLELGRFVLHDRVPANGETLFLARCLRLLGPEGIRGVVSFADPVVRRDATGSLVFPGHWGAAYQAGSAIYAGRGAARSLYLLPDGRVLNERALSKVTRLERGHRYVEDLLRQYGANARAGANPRAWLAGALRAAGVRRLFHPGCHRYLFRVGGRVQRRHVVLPPTAAYPRGIDDPAFDSSPPIDDRATPD